MFYMKRIRINLPSLVITLAVVSILLMSTLGLSNFGKTKKMDADGHMTMSDCFMPGMTVLCNMSPLEHMTQWQHLFTALPIQLGALALLLLMALFLTGVVARLRLFLPSSPPIRSFHRDRYKYVVFDPFRLAMSRGIIHPKVF